MQPNSSAHVPSTYDGREQAFIKHSLLKIYLEKLVMIMGMSPAARTARKIEICYVDCFAGPWGDASDDLAGTSIAIAAQILADCKEALAALGVTAKMRALFIEKNSAAFARLQKYLEQQAPKSVETACVRGSFLDLRQEILRWCGSNAFAFFFIDPKGWKEIGVEALQPLLLRPRSEFLINFMYMFVNRAASMAEQQAAIRALLGAEVDLTGLSPEAREARLLGLYREGLKAQVPHPWQAKYAARTAYARILDVEKERVKYHLVYLSSHPKGIDEFMKASEKAELVQRTVRDHVKTVARAQEAQTQDMFGEDLSLDRANARAAGEEIDRYWLRLLAGGIVKIGLDEFADILQETDWFPGELQASLVSLIDQGLVVNLDAAKKRPQKPLHYEHAERLQALVPPASLAK